MNKHVTFTIDGAFLLGSGPVLFVAWLGATATGYVMGTMVQDPARRD